MSKNDLQVVFSPELTDTKLSDQMPCKRFFQADQSEMV